MYLPGIPGHAFSLSGGSNGDETTRGEGGVAANQGGVVRDGGGLQKSLVWLDVFDQWLEGSNSALEPAIPTCEKLRLLWNSLLSLILSYQPCLSYLIK